MNLLNPVTIALWLAVCISALAVAYSNHKARTLFAQWQEQVKLQQSYEVQWGQLLIEKSSLANYARLENLAAKRLNMVVPKVNQMIRVEEK